MKKQKFSVLIILLMAVLVHGSIHVFAADNPAIGIWQGSVTIQSIQLRIVFHVGVDSSGMLKSTMDSPDQGAKGIPVKATIAKQESLIFEMPDILLRFAGARQTGDSLIVGKLNQGGMSFPLTFHRITEVKEVARPQNPKPPFPYLAEEVTYPNRSANITLAGTWTRPKTGAPFPAVILITGSGPQNRDEELLGHKPFLVLADYLTRRGIAVLRVDDRGIGKSTGNFRAATSMDFAADVRAGMDYLKTRSDVNPKKIGLLGHSEGGLIAPMVATDSKDVAFVVMMAGPSISGEQILYLQDSLISLGMGRAKEDVARGLASMRAIYQLLKAEADTAKLRSELFPLVMQSIPIDSATSKEAKEMAANAGTAQLMTPWFRFFLTYEPAPALSKMKCPVLALNGGKDAQVPPKENLEGMRKAFAKSGNKRATVTMLPGLNHLFQKAETGMPGEYARIEETINEDALKVIGDWILEATK